MAYYPVVSISRSQNVRLGHGPGNRVPAMVNYSGDVNPQSGNLFHAFYADLNQGDVRKDIGRHSSIGALLAVGGVSASPWSDLFAPTGGVVSAGTGLTVNVSAIPVLTSRIFSGSISVAAASGLALSANNPVLSTDTFYTVVAKANGSFGVQPGVEAQSPVVYEVDSVSVSGTPTGGTFTLSFTYNGFNYTTAGIAYNAAASAVASAVLAATGGPKIPGALTGSGGPLPGAAVTLTASGALEGAINNQSINVSALTGGTNTAGTFSQTTAGSGASPSPFGGNDLPLAYVFVPSTATSSANFTITNIVQTS